MSPLLYPLSYGTQSAGPVILVCGRGSGIRTHDILLPKQALYQTEPYPVFKVSVGVARRQPDAARTLSLPI